MKGKDLKQERRQGRFYKESKLVVPGQECITVTQHLVLTELRFLPIMNDRFGCRWFRANYPRRYLGLCSDKLWSK